MNDLVYVNLLGSFIKGHCRDVETVIISIEFPPPTQTDYVGFNPVGHVFLTATLKTGFALKTCLAMSEVAIPNAIHLSKVRETVEQVKRFEISIRDLINQQFNF